MRPWLPLLIASVAFPVHAGAAPVAYEVQPGSSITQCSSGELLPPCVVAPVSGIVELDALQFRDAMLDTSGAPLGDPMDGSLDLAVAIWSGLNQLVGAPLPIRSLVTGWRFTGTINGASINVVLTEYFGRVEILGGTAATDSYTGPQVIIDVSAIRVPEPTRALLLIPVGLALAGLRRG